MKILFISSQALFSQTRFGGAKRLYYLARELESNVELHLLCMDGAGEFPEEKPFPHEFHRQLFLDADPLWKSRSMFSGDKLSFLPGMPEIISHNRHAIATFLEGQQFDATLCAYMPSLYFLEQEWLPRMGRLFYMEDDLVLEGIRNDITHGKTWRRRFMARLRYRQGLMFFRHKLKHVVSFICISREEEKVVRELFPFLSTHILKYGVPMEDYPFLAPSEKESVLGFIGNYQHPPNIAALHWLVDELFPHFSMRFPEARLVLGGKNFPIVVLKKCSHNPAIRILEDVENLATFYQAIGTFINPMQEGRGLRTKVIEACAFGRPVLSTALGAEGLEELELGLFKNKEQFVEAFLSMVRDGNLSETTKHNRDAVQSLFSLKKIGNDLMEMLREKPHRFRNNTAS